jgi:hypothetical protein
MALQLIPIAAKAIGAAVAKGGAAKGAAGAAKGKGLLSKLGGLGKKAKGIGEAPLYAAKGLIGAISARKAQKKADASMPSTEDPEERSALNYTKRQRRALDTGTKGNAARKDLRAMFQTGAQKFQSAGGGVQGLSMMNQMFAKSMLANAAADQDRSVKYNQQSIVQTKDIADRKLQLGMLQNVRDNADAKRKKKNSNESLNLAVAKFTGTGKKPKGTAAAISRYGTGAADATDAGAPGIT